MATGVRQTTQISRPSWRVRKEAESATSAAATSIHPPKCSAPCDSSDHRVTKKAIINVDNNDSDDSSDNNGGTTTEPATEPASDDYEALKAMADADNQVHSPSVSISNSITIYLSFQAVTFRTKADCTADIHLMFCREKGYIHPDSGKVLDGHWCTTCR